MNAHNRLQPDDSEYLSVLRALSIFIIVFGHVGGFWFCRPWSEFLHVFVPIFFFISGAVSYNSFLKHTSTNVYIKKRVISILVPYYCICFFAMFVYIYDNKSLPTLSTANILRWLTITPYAGIMPFPLGQVWFLHTLLIISLLSPIFFYLYEKHSIVLAFYLLASIAISAVQLNYNISPFFLIAGNNFFKPLVHSLFFCLGFIVIDIKQLRSLGFSISAIIFFGLMSYILVAVLSLNPDYEFHTYAPDLYYVAGSLCTIWLFILAQPFIMKIYRNRRAIQVPIRFLFHNTFSIYLLHSFAIYLTETYLNLVNPQQKTIIYGIIKLTIVLAITLIMSPFFTKLHQFLSKKFLSIIDGAANQLIAKRLFYE